MFLLLVIECMFKIQLLDHFSVGLAIFGFGEHVHDVILLRNLEARKLFAANSLYLVEVYCFAGNRLNEYRRHLASSLVRNAYRYCVGPVVTPPESKAMLR